MSLYQFLPSSDVQGKEENFAWWDNGFDDEDIKRITDYVNKLETIKAVVGDGQYHSEIRESNVVWLGNNDEISWLYDKLAYIARMVNGQYFQFDLFGFSEDIQYTVYNGDDKGHYDWHIDKGFRQGSAPRKLSMVVQLTDPSEYEGGDLEFNLGTNETVKATKKKGIVYLFPSWVLHRVTPVTKGTRKSLVIWICGPKFR